MANVNILVKLKYFLTFQNVHVEVLYQRYFLRMNQNNMTSLLSLLIAIAVTMIIVNYELSSADSIMQGVTLGVFSIMYLILVILMTRSFLNEVYLIIFSYIVLASFFGIEVLIVLDSDPRSANAGVWCTMFFIYMTYTLLALHVEECTVSGLLLGFTQVICHNVIRSLLIVEMFLVPGGLCCRTQLYR